MNILITGGAGYIGSITNALLRQRGIKTVIFDNLSLGNREAVGDSKLIVGDLTNFSDIKAAFDEETFDGVMHFAAFSLAGQSMSDPYAYYRNNCIGGMNLLEAMRLHGCKRLIFSSTSAVYGYPKKLPITEEEHIQPVSVYGSSKWMIEEMIHWFERIYNIRSVILRYFNAAGALLDGRLGEHHRNESHIIPIALDVASSRRPVFEVYGNDYETPDGTCIRDYIHVVDLAQAHIQAFDYLLRDCSSAILNLGVGRGYSNNEVLDTVERITGRNVSRVYKARRPGDPMNIYADNAKARRLLSWEPKYSDLETIIASAWKWHQKDVNGYADRN